MEAAAVPADWAAWLRDNRDRGCRREELVDQALRQGGLPRLAIEAVLDGAPAADLDGLRWFEAPLTRPQHRPRAWRLDTPLAQLYELPDLLSRETCAAVIAAIDQQLVPSAVTQGDGRCRTSRTCHLPDSDAPLAAALDAQLAALVGVDPAYSEPLQGQRYDVGQFFAEHADWFEPDSAEFAVHGTPGGQRTWTVMVYLNSVERGGQTCFPRLGRCFTPVPGMALAWNNLQADGRPNPFTCHEAKPVEAGCKWVLTKWFRAAPGRNG